MESSMRLRFVFAVLAAFVCSSGSAGQKSTAEHPDIGKSGNNFLKVCSSVDSEWNGDPVRFFNDATCLGWVDGFADGFTVHDELLGVPHKDRMVCVPHEVTTIQIIRVIKKYIADNPDKSHR